MKTVRLCLDYYHPWPNNAPVFMARHRGFFEDEGIEIELIYADPFLGDGLFYLETNRTDLAVSYPNRLMTRVANGAPLQSIAALNERPMESLVWRDSVPIHRARDLEGKRVGYRRSERLTAMLNALVELDGGDPKLVEHVECYPAEPMPEDLRDGVFDVMFGALWAWEGLHGPILDSLCLRHCEVDQCGIPPYNAQVLVVRQPYPEETLRKFVRALEKGAYAVANNLQEAGSLMHSAAPYFSSSLHRASLEWVSKNWNLHAGWGQHNFPALREYSQWLQQNGLLKEDVSLESIFRDPQVLV